MYVIKMQGLQYYVSQNNVRISPLFNKECDAESFILYLIDNSNQTT